MTADRPSPALAMPSPEALTELLVREGYRHANPAILQPLTPFLDLAQINAAGETWAQSLEGAGIGMGLRDSDTELQAKFNTAIQSMKDDGSLNTMIKKWFGDEAVVF